MKACLTAVLLLAASVLVNLQAQQSQNPSPMVEHTRDHPRLTESHPAGRREKLSLGTLFLPAKLGPHSHPRLLFFFHGGDWIPEVSATRQKNMAVVSVQAGAGSGSYTALFTDPKRFLTLINEAQTKSGLIFSEVDLGGWSAGCGALRQILLDPTSYARVQRVLCIDGVHTGYPGGKPGPTESTIDPTNLQTWLQFGRDAIAGRKRLIITHTEIFPGTFASTTEAADYLLHEWNLKPHPVAQFGPMRTQMLSHVHSGGLDVYGFAGNSAPDHVDQIHSLPTYLQWLAQK